MSSDTETTKEPATDVEEGSITNSTTALLRSMRYTSASRFIAARRLEKRDATITLLIALISIYIVTITLMPYFFRFPPEISSTLSLITVVLSIAILVSSLLHRSNNDSMKSEQHHRCALEINELRRELMAHQHALSPDRFIAFSKQYNSILHKYSINHEYIDYLKVQIEKYEEFPWRGPFGRTLVRLRLVTAGRLPHVAMLAITATVICVIFLYTLPARLVPAG